VPRGVQGDRGHPQRVLRWPRDKEGTGLKWCAWIAVYCSFISFANSRSSEDTKQMMSSFMLSISAVVMSYLQNPQPMSPPW
uniref:PAT complex subunit Asterix n=1 Tax=Buteo japonicus TaxID=224669 RepID=A0A8C0BMK4_9AVES